MFINFIRIIQLINHDFGDWGLGPIPNPHKKIFFNLILKI